MAHKVQVRLRGSAVRDLLRREGDSVPRLAERMGVNRSYLHRVLEGERTCSWERLAAMAAHLRVDPTTIADVLIDDREPVACDTAKPAHSA